MPLAGSDSGIGDIAPVSVPIPAPAAGSVVGGVASEMADAMAWEPIGAPITPPEAAALEATLTPLLNGSPVRVSNVRIEGAILHFTMTLPAYLAQELAAAGVVDLPPGHEGPLSTDVLCPGDPADVEAGLIRVRTIVRNPDCREGSPGCSCAIAPFGQQAHVFPYEELCPDCRDQPDRDRTSYCVCGPKDA